MFLKISALIQDSFACMFPYITYSYYPSTARFDLKCTTLFLVWSCRDRIIYLQLMQNIKKSIQFCRFNSISATNTNDKIVKVSSSNFAPRTLNKNNYNMLPQKIEITSILSAIFNLKFTDFKVLKYIFSVITTNW